MEVSFLGRKTVSAVARAKRVAGDTILKASMVAAAAAAPVLSFAQTADPNQAKIDEAGTKMVGYAVTVVGIMVGFWAVKRAGQKMGWW